ncbi:TPA_asm: L protein [Sphaeridiorhabdovirus 3]|nr:TPA_asm: L protein [Sphaeridiorhabdovirus 3]
MDYLDQDPVLDEEDYLCELVPEEQDSLDRKQLRQEDYTLDSPIILDNLEAAYLHRHSTHFDGKPMQKQLKEMFDLLESPVKPTEIHQTLAQLILDGNTTLRNFSPENPCVKSLMSKLSLLYLPSDSSEEICNAFFRSLTDLKTEHQSRWPIFKQRIKEELSHGDSDLRTYWMIYLTFHLIVLLMNRIEDDEIQAISSYIPEAYTDTTFKFNSKTGLVHFESPFLGPIVVNRSGCCISKFHLVLDKNLTLMIQDIMSNRVNSLILLLYPDERYSPGLFQMCEKLYRQGDLLISRHGNASFDTIKLIEPICNNVIKKLAESPYDVISSSKFQDYLESEIQERIQQHGKEAFDWFQILQSIDNIYDAVFIFGIFRHWGHPYIEYYEGLQKLHENVTLEKDINTAYVNKLASDLARKIFKYSFKKNKRWPIDTTDLDENHLLMKHFKDHTWPNRSEERSFGDRWHTLPMSKVFDVPTTVNLSEILDDKSHSLNYSALRQAISEGHIGLTRDRKVLISTLFTPEVNVYQLLKKIDEEGLSKEDLVIGLRAKERELKRIGRFFALMTFNLRIYFVVTELMIAKHILPLFPSLTMSTSLNDVFKKMTQCVPGHGTDQTEHISYAEHFDYEKWNNHQRYESTAPIFKVMDKAFGFKNLIARTHEIFQKSFVYFANKPEHMEVVDGVIRNKPGSPLVCWHGQAGGLEGLRQKGWSIISLLMINRESRNRNPRVRTLAQGDNQVVCITYKLPSFNTPTDRLQNLKELSENKNHLLACIYGGASKLGLIIKPDESWGSFNYLIYGKFALIGGNLICSESKRYSRVNSVSNDLIQNMSNSLSSAVTTCLTVCQQSDSVTKAIHMYLVYGSCVIRNILAYNLSICKPIRDWKAIEQMDTQISRILFLDSSLGGLGGSSLLRFFVRQFPDAVTESLTFWKAVASHTENPTLQNLAWSCGHPNIERAASANDIMRLIESPTSLNCKTGVNVSSILKTLVREELFNRQTDIKHQTIRECVRYSKLERSSFLMFLNSIMPRFPRFLSNFYDASIHGFTDSIVGLIQNSRTIRAIFTARFSEQVCERIRQSELESIESLLKPIPSGQGQWLCSAERADNLRHLSWGPIIGATVPHPCELIEIMQAQRCSKNHNLKDYTTSHCQLPLKYYPHFKKGPCTPYLGSTTSDLTEMYNSWERKTDHILLKKAVGLRVVLNWFVREGTNLHKAMIDNLASMTNDDATSLMSPGPTRGGSFVHRYKTPHQSSGGFSSINHNKLQYILTTTDTMADLSHENWDFMYQSVILYAQTVISSLSTVDLSNSIFHGHIACQSCLRPVKECMLETRVSPPPFPILTGTTSLYVDKDIMPFVITQVKLEDIPLIEAKEIQDEVSLQIGILQGYLHTIHQCYKLELDDLGSLFPKAVFDKLCPYEYLAGFLMGVIRGTVINSMSQQFMMSSKDRVSNLKGQIFVYLSRLSETRDIASLISADQFSTFLSRVSHVTGSQYPLNENEILNLLRTYLIGKISNGFNYWATRITRTTRVILFPETMTTFTACGLVFSIPLVEGTLIRNNMDRDDIRGYKELLVNTCQYGAESEDLLKAALKRSQVSLCVCNSDLRTVGKYAIVKPRLNKNLIPSYEEYEGESEYVDLDTMTTPRNAHSVLVPYLQRFCPLISGLRVVQIQTGAHYKLKCLFKYLKKAPTYVLCCADYSGGFSSLILRKYPLCRVVFNSLLDLRKFPSGGIHPAPPSAISRLPECQKLRCINFDSAWEEQSNIESPETWNLLIKKFPRNSIDLVVIDAEYKDEESFSSIVTAFLGVVSDLAPNHHLIMKIQYISLFSPRPHGLDRLCSIYNSVIAATTEYTGSFSSEFYVVAHRIRTQKENRFLDTASCSGINRIVKCNRSPKEEFIRACHLKLANTCKGLTGNFWLSPVSVLSGILLSMNIAPVIAEKIHQNFSAARSFNQFVAGMLFGLGYILKELNIKFDNKKGMVDGFPVPSADWLEKYMAFLMGSLYYFTYLLGRADLFEMLTDVKSFVLHCDDRVGCLRWSFYPGDDDHTIRLRYNTQRHLASTWIRIWESFRFERNLDISSVKIGEVAPTFCHAVLGVSFKKFNMDYLHRMTGFKDLCKLIFPDLWSAFFEHRCPECIKIEGMISSEGIDSDDVSEESLTKVQSSDEDEKSDL